MDSKTTFIAQRREYPRIPFRAIALVIQPTSADVVSGITREISQFGCFVETTTPLRLRSRIHIELEDGPHIFRTSGVVAYVTAEGMGIAFGLVEAKNYQILAKWLSRTTDTANN